MPVIYGRDCTLVWNGRAFIPCADGEVVMVTAEMMHRLPGNWIEVVNRHIDGLWLTT